MIVNIRLPEGWTKTGTTFYNRNTKASVSYRCERVGIQDAIYYLCTVSYINLDGKSYTLSSKRFATISQCEQYLQDKVSALIRGLSGNSNYTLTPYHQERLSHLHNNLIIFK